LVNKRLSQNVSLERKGGSRTGKSIGADGKQSRNSGRELNKSHIGFYKTHSPLTTDSAGVSMPHSAVRIKQNNTFTDPTIENPYNQGTTKAINIEKKTTTSDGKLPKREKRIFNMRYME
jgi:hypothetical protein